MLIQAIWIYVKCFFFCYRHTLNRHLAHSSQCDRVTLTSSSILLIFIVLPCSSFLHHSCCINLLLLGKRDACDLLLREEVTLRQVSYDTKYFGCDGGMARNSVKLSISCSWGYITEILTRQGDRIFFSGEK